METLIAISIILGFGFVPMLIYAAVLWWFDRYEKEPILLLAAAFLWGAVPAILFSLIAELVLGIPISAFVDPSTAAVVGAAVIAPIVEEVFKSSLLWYWVVAEWINRAIKRAWPTAFRDIWARIALAIPFPPFFQEFDSALDGIIYGGLAGFGFAAVENVFYLVRQYNETGNIGDVVFLAFLRAFVFGLNHAMFTGLTGLGLALARNTRNWVVKIGAPILGLALGILAHAAHNAGASFSAASGNPCFCLLSLTSDYGGTLALLIVIIWATIREQRWIAQHLADEVPAGTLTQDSYTVVCSYLKRVGMRTRALFSGNIKRWQDLGRYYHQATELAFAKRRLSQYPADAEVQQRVAVLRRDVAERGQRLGI